MPQTAQQLQAHRYYFRRSRLEREDPKSRLYLSRKFGLGATESTAGLATTDPVTVSFELVTNNANASGVIFEVGDGTTCLGMALDGSGGLEVVAGDDGGADTIADVSDVAGQLSKIVLVVNGGSKEYRVYHNGEEKLRSTYTSTGWAADITIGVGEQRV